LFPISIENNISRDCIVLNDERLLLLSYSKVTQASNWDPENMDLLVLITDYDGNILNYNHWGGEWFDIAQDIIETSDGNYLIVGSLGANTGTFYDEPKFLFLKVDSQLNEIWRGTYDGPNIYSRAVSTVEVSDGYIISGYSYNREISDYGAVIINVEKDGTDIEDNYELSINNYELKQNYPNPFNPVTKINYELRITNYELAEIVVYNSVGQIVGAYPCGRPAFGTTGKGSIQFDGSNLNSGVYYYSLVVDGKRMSTKPMILIK